MSNQPQQSSYDEAAQQYVQAYEAFCSIYEKKYPVPSPRTTQTVNKFIIAALILITVSSIIVSASRTFVEFGGDFIGAFSIAMLEGGIAAYAFYKAFTTVSKEKVKSTQRLASIGFTTAIIITVAANIHSVLRVRGYILPDFINAIINVMAAFSAPILAFISSDILAVEIATKSIFKSRAEEATASDMEAYRQKMNDAWEIERVSKWQIKDKISVSRPRLEPITPPQPSPRLSSGTSQETSPETTQETTQAVSAGSTLEAALKILRDDPSLLSLSYQQLADTKGFSKSTWGRVVPIYRKTQSVEAEAS